MSKINKAPKTTSTAPKNGSAPAASITPEQAMLVIGEFARERGTGWREALRAFWIGEGDESALYAARALVPAAILDNLNFAPPKKPRALKPLTPAQDVARRLGKVASAMRAQAAALQVRSKECRDRARRLKGKDDAAIITLRALIDGGELAKLETEVGI